MHQSKYTNDVLKRFHMADCNTALTPAETNLVNVQTEEEKQVEKTLYRQMIGTLRYICNTRPDIAHGVGVASRFMENPLHSHIVVVKRIMRYLRGTHGLGIRFPSKHNTSCRLELIGFSDADWCGDKSDRKSTTGYLFKLGGAPISWCSKKQDVVALSSCESEYIAASMCARQAAWMSTLMEELGLKEEGDGFLLMVDNKSAINLALNPVAHGRSKI
ncbi:unnamed protein product [Lupinus luteus]|uniref:Uncharacterized protein n=1 Tax=Lupinus luteus TaxID=3873 RepID=A0AAV1VZJ2_LUPLU